MVHIYSWELENYLKIREYMLSKDEYFFVTDTTKQSQINHIKYEPYENLFKICTEDGYSWEVTINNNGL